MDIKVTYFVYILHCADGSYYTGKTRILGKRIKQHNGIISGGAKYTRTRRPVSIAYLEECLDNRAASMREERIKQLTRLEKARIITMGNESTLAIIRNIVPDQQ